MNLEIECDYANIESKYHSNKLKVGLQNVDLDFLGQINEEQILQGFDNRLLFEKLIENDEDILHDYLTKNNLIKTLKNFSDEEIMKEYSDRDLDVYYPPLIKWWL